MRRIQIARHPGLALAISAWAVLGCADQGFESQVASRDISQRDRGETPPSAAESPAADANPSATAGRKIIYNAQVDLVTDDLAALESTLTKLIATQKAYVADSERTGSAGATRRGTWKVRVPVDAYDVFVKGVVGLGELVSLKADSQDVSEEFFDLEARQTAKKVEEARLLKHLTESTGKLDEILTVERELSRVRSEIERMQGRLRAIGNLTTLATVNITASEIKGYVPPQAPTLGTRVARTFAGSLDSLRLFGEAILIAFVAVVPWLPLIAAGLGIVAWIARRSVVRIPPNGLIDAPPPPGRRG